MLDILMGFIYIIGDLIYQLYKIIIGILKTFLTNSKNNNEFIKLIYTPNFFIDIGIYLGLFWFISAYSVIIAIIATIIFGFYWYDFKKKLYDRYNDCYFTDHDESLYWAFFLNLFFITIFIIYQNINTPYSYKKVGEYNITKEKLYYNGIDNNGRLKDTLSKHSSITLDINHNEEKINTGKCKEGKTIIYKETLKPFHIRYLYTDYVFGCSGYKQNIDKIITKNNRS